MSSISLSYVKYQISGIIFFMIFSKKTSVTWRTQRIDLKKLPLHKWESLWICGFCQFSFGQFEQWIDQSLLCKKEETIEQFFSPSNWPKYSVTWRTLFCDVTDALNYMTQNYTKRLYKLIFYIKIDSSPPLFTYM